jgi:predicted transposase YbfD/YdcC
MESTSPLPHFDHLSAADRAALLTNRTLRSLADVFAVIPDPRSCHGKRYSLPFLLTCLAAALLCGYDSADAVSQWCREHRALLRRLFGPRTHLSPSGSLYRWLLPQLDAARLEWALAGWIATTRPTPDHEAVALDAKNVCGAGPTTAKQPTLLAITTHNTEETLVQVRVPAGTNETPIAPQLLDWMPLTDRLVTADAAHCQIAFTRAVLERGGHYLVCLKANWPELYGLVVTAFAQQDLCCTEAESYEQRRGRCEQRRLRVTSALCPRVAVIPGVAQVAEITRTIARPGRVREEEVRYYLTSRPPASADAATLLSEIRDHWSIERHFWIRDMVFGEDASALRIGAAPQVMAALRNAAITLIRRAGWTGITAARRHFAAHPGRAITLIRRRTPARI